MNTLVISGGSRGIGLASARLFAAAGWRVINLSRTPCTVAGVIQHSIDMGAADWVARHGEALRQAAAGSERIALVHSAGFLGQQGLRDVSTADLRRALQINVVAALELNQLMLPLMGQGSSIIYVGSTLSEKAVPGALSYVVSKHAVVGLMRASCQDLAGSGIHTVCVCPGFTDTDMLREHMGDSAEMLEALQRGITFGRLIEPEEIARTIEFCALNPVINGAVIHANLGQIER